jgi:hypothetical protein
MEAFILGIIGGIVLGAIIGYSIAAVAYMVELILGRV